jgi:hypothetical protein
MRNVYRILDGKPEGKMPLGRSRYGWKNNVGMDLREIGWKDVDRIHLTQDREHGNEPSGSMKGGEFLD